VNTPQGNNITRNVSDAATNNTPSPRIYDEKKRCWICNDEKHLASSCLNKPPSDIDILPDKITETDKTTTTNESVPIRYWCKEPTLRMVNFVNVDTKGISRCVYLSATINGKNVLCMCDADTDVNFLPYDFVDPKSIKPTAMKFYAANGTTIEILGQARVTVQLANQIKCETDVLISDRLACPMFGKQ